MEDTGGSRDGRLRRGLSWLQMAEVAERRGDPELAAEFRRLAERDGDGVPSGRECAVPPPRESRG